MKRPRVSIGWVMAIVVLVSLDLCHLRWLLQEPWVWSGREPFITALTLPPMLNVLSMVGIMLFRDLRRKGESRAFSTGFFVCGIGGTLLVTALTALYVESSLEGLGLWFEAVIGSSLNGKLAYENQNAIVAILLSLLLMLPQLIVALSGASSTVDSAVL